MFSTGFLGLLELLGLLGLLIIPKHRSSGRRCVSGEGYKPLVCINLNTVFDSAST